METYYKTTVKIAYETNKGALKYKSMGIKTYSPAKGISFDLEAFCTNLDKYKANFQNYFKKSPILID